MLTPLARNAPRLWPADPLNLIFTVSSGNSSAPWALANSLLRIVHVVRSVLMIGNSISTASPFSKAGLASSSSFISSTLSRP